MPPPDSGHTDAPHHQLKTTKVVGKQGLKNKTLGEVGNIQEPVPPLAVHVRGIDAVFKDGFGAQEPGEMGPEKPFVRGMWVQGGISVEVVVSVIGDLEHNTVRVSNCRGLGFCIFC